MDKEIKMTGEENAVDRQAAVCARMGMDLATVERIATAKRWHGVLRKRLVNRYLNHRRKTSVNPF